MSDNPPSQIKEANAGIQKRPLSENEVSILILIAAVLLGGWFRFMPAWLAGFPVNDGGMFYTMMKELRQNNFVPPLYTNYNNLNIPFVYPPFALYIGAFPGETFGVSGIDILRWLPALVNTLTIPAFYALAKEILREKSKSAIAALAFALTPHMTAWLSMGGGLTRSFGTLFMLLTALFSHRLFTTGGRNNIFPTILFGSLTALSHTESTVFAIVIPILFWTFASRTFQGFKLGAVVAVGVVLLAGPWYAFAVIRHGFDPLLSALKTGGQTPLVFLLLFNFRGITAEPFLDLLGVTGFLGLMRLIAKRQYLIPVMYGLIYLTQPRSAHTIVNIPLAMAAGTFFTDAVLPKFKSRVALLISLVTPLLLANIVYESYLLSLNHVDAEEFAAFQWAADNTPAESRFLVLTGEPLAFCDSTSEWFPALTGRHSVTTAQGREWIDGENINDFIRHKADMEKCLDTGLECVTNEAAYFGEETDYIYISPAAPAAACNRLSGFIPELRALFAALEESVEFRIVYRSGETVIFEKGYEGR